MNHEEFLEKLGAVKRELLAFCYPLSDAEHAIHECLHARLDGCWVDAFPLMPAATTKKREFSRTSKAAGDCSLSPKDRRVDRDNERDRFAYVVRNGVIPGGDVLLTFLPFAIDPLELIERLIRVLLAQRGVDLTTDARRTIPSRQAVRLGWKVLARPWACAARTAPGALGAPLAHGAPSYRSD